MGESSVWGTRISTTEETCRRVPAAPEPPSGPSRPLRTSLQSAADKIGPIAHKPLTVGAAGAVGGRSGRAARRSRGRPDGCGRGQGLPLAHSAADGGRRQQPRSGRWPTARPTGSGRWLKVRQTGSVRWPVRPWSGSPRTRKQAVDRVSPVRAAGRRPGIALCPHRRRTHCPDRRHRQGAREPGRHDRRGLSPGAGRARRNGSLRRLKWLGTRCPTTCCPARAEPERRGREPARRRGGSKRGRGDPGRREGRADACPSRRRRAGGSSGWRSCGAGCTRCGRGGVPQVLRYQGRRLAGRPAEHAVRAHRPGRKPAPRPASPTRGPGPESDRGGDDAAAGDDPRPGRPPTAKASRPTASRCRTSRPRAARGRRDVGDRRGGLPAAEPVAAETRWCSANQPAEAARRAADRRGDKCRR